MAIARGAIGREAIFQGGGGKFPGGGGAINRGAIGRGLLAGGYFPGAYYRGLLPRVAILREAIVRVAIARGRLTWNPQKHCKEMLISSFIYFQALDKYASFLSSMWS